MVTADVRDAPAKRPSRGGGVFMPCRVEEHDFKIEGVRAPGVFMKAMSSHSQTLHGTAKYADQLAWFEGSM